VRVEKFLFGRLCSTFEGKPSKTPASFKKLILESGKGLYNGITW